MYDRTEVREFSAFSPERRNNPHVESVKQQMNNFLGLLQKSIDQERMLQHHAPHHESEPEKKLSTILSASEQGESCEGREIRGSSHSSRHYDKYLDSSSLQDTFLKPLIDKNTQKAIFNITQQQNRSTITSPRLAMIVANEQQSKHEPSYKLFDDSQFLVECESALTGKHSHLAIRLHQLVRDYNDYVSVLQHRNEELLVKCEKYRLKSQHLLKALYTVRDEEKTLVQKYTVSKQQLEQHEKSTKQLLIINDRLDKEVEVLRSQNTYLKNLIILANKNYENIQRKLIESEEKCKKIESSMRHRQSQLLEGNIVLKDIILKLGKDGRSGKDSSPLRDRTNEEQNRQQSQQLHQNSKLTEVEQTYRKMFLKTLKCPKK